MRGPARALVALALIAGSAALAWRLATGADPRAAALFAIGIGLGFTLLHASFSFAGGLRLFLRERRSAALRAQFLLLGLATLLLLPVLHAGGLAGYPARGFVFPTGLALLAGAFLFGIGMQIGGGCASGTLYTAGGGSLRMALTLAAFVAGATLAAWQAPLWIAWPALPPLSLAGHWGLWPTLAASLALIALAHAAAARAERRRHASLAPLVAVHGARRARWLRGPWPLLAGAILLALLNLATLVLAGRPWAITAAFPLWGAKALEALGAADPAFWPYWEDPTRTEALLRPLAADRMSLMNLGLLAGAALAALIAGRRAHLRLRLGEVAASLLGGLLLGIGAVLATGCNISAWIGGTASGSLHGWAWILPALAGNAAGLRLRPLFGLDPAPAR